MNDVVDVVYPVRGDAVRVGYQYVLFSALCYRHNLKNRPEIRVGPLEGLRPIGARMLAIGPDTQLRVRAPRNGLGFVRDYARARIMCGAHAIQLGKPSVRMIRPASTLHSVIVTFGFRDGYDWSRYVEHSTNELRKYGGMIHMGRIRSLRVGKRTFIGHAIEMSGLCEEASVALQSAQIGGRGHFGGGVFIPGALPRSLA